MSPPGHQLRPIGHHASLAGSATGLELLPGFCFFRTHIEQCRLRRSVLAQFGHLIYTAFRRLLLLSLVPAL
jgi:hypothetical protein